MFGICAIFLAVFRLGINAEYVEENLNYTYPIEMTFKQRLDHFNPADDQFFDQRYFVSDQYWDRQNGPLFFYCGNEGAIEVFIENSGFIWDLAPLFKAKVIFAEHRYYGKTLPFGHIKPSNKTKARFSKLTAEQALADYAVLLSSELGSAKTFRSNHLPIITFGGSYGGMLSAWMRIKYPHIVTGAIASSAPINYFYNEVNCSKFNEVVTKNFHSVPQFGKHCVQNIANSWSIFKKFDQMRWGMEKLSSMFNTCEELTSSSQLVNWIVDTFSELAMVDYPYPTNFLAPLPAWPLNKTCEMVGEPNLQGMDLLDAMFDAVSVFQNASGAVECFDVKRTDNSSVDSSLWDYMTCGEMVMPFCSNGKTDMFPVSSWSLKSFTEQCQLKFGLTPRPFWENINFGGNNLKYASNILFLNGELDPWHVGSPLSSPSSTVHVINMWGAAHHLDLRHVHSENPESVKAAHNKEIQLIKLWVS